MPRGNALSASLGKSLPPTTPFGGAVHRMLRAAFLDAGVYRELSTNAAHTTEAVIAAVVALLCVSIGPVFFGVLAGNLSLSSILSLLAVQVVSLVAFVLGAALSAPVVIGRKLEPLELFRPVAYAQSVGVLGIVPVVGPLLSLWRIVTTTAAIKDSTGVDTGKAVTLLVAGAVCGAIAAAVLGPILFSSLGGIGGFYR